VVADDSPAKNDPSYSSITTACDWARSGDYTDIILERSTGEDSGIAKITINRPEKRNAFRPQTVQELIHAFDVVRDDPSVGVVILTGQGDWAFCSGGDQMIRGDVWSVIFRLRLITRALVRLAQSLVHLMVDMVQDYLPVTSVKKERAKFGSCVVNMVQSRHMTGA